jgi:hypothetical protein
MGFSFVPFSPLDNALRAATNSTESLNVFRAAPLLDPEFRSVDAGGDRNLLRANRDNPDKQAEQRQAKADLFASNADIRSIFEGAASTQPAPSAASGKVKSSSGKPQASKKSANTLTRRGGGGRSVSATRLNASSLNKKTLLGE